jgi:hypothetical protein
VGVCAVGFGLLGQNCPGSTYGTADVVTWQPDGRSIPTRGFSAVDSRPLAGVWCPSTWFCLASDDAGHLLSSSATPMAGGSGWSPVLDGGVSSDGYDPVDDVSCPSASSCIAIDNDGAVLATDAAARAAAAVTSSAARRRLALPRFHRTATRVLATERPALRRPRRQARGVPWRYLRRTWGLNITPRPDERPAAGSASSSAHLARAVATTSSGVGYGLATPRQLGGSAAFVTCTVDVAPCPSGDLQGWFNRTSPSSFANLLTGLPLSYARFFIPYDALMSVNGDRCVASPADTSGVGHQDFMQLVWEVQAAQADDLTPVVAFTGGTGIGGVPSTPDPSYGTVGSRPWGTWTVAAYDYECGVYGIMDAIGSAGLGSNPVIDWEAWNEPNGSAQFNGALSGECNSRSSSCGGVYNSGGYLCYSDDTACGPLEAAELWEIAHHVAEYSLHDTQLQIAALTVSDAQNSPYEASYIKAIRAMSQCASGY